MERDIFSVLYLCSRVEVLPSTLPFRLTQGATAFELSALALACRRNYSTHPETPLSLHISQAGYLQQPPVLALSS
jgi:hypothetical protein